MAWKTGHARVIILTGWPGVGKTTVARRIAERTGFPLLDDHLTYAPIIRFLRKGSRRAHELNVQVRGAILEMLLRSPIPGTVVTTGYRRKAVGQFIALAVDLGTAFESRIDIVRLVCDWDEHKRRVTSPTRHGIGKTRTVQELKRKMATPPFLGLPDYPPLVIDTTALSPERCAARIIRKLEVPTLGIPLGRTVPG